MNILFTQKYLPEKGGSIYWMSKLFKDWPQKLLIFTHRYEDTEAESNIAGLRIVRSDILQKDWGLDSLDSLVRYFRMFFNLKKLITRDQATVIHCARILPEALIVGLLKLFNKKIKLIAFVHGEDLKTYQTSKQLKLYSKWAIKQVDHLVANSSFTKDLLKDKASNEKIIKLNPCIDYSSFQISSSKSDLKRKFKIDDQALVILSLGRLVSKKNHKAVISSVAEIVKTNPNIVYLIAGDGPCLNALQKQVDSLKINKHVLFLGEVSDSERIELFNLSDIFVSPSRMVEQDVEGFGIVYVEAAACGLPIIAGSSGGEADAIMEDQNAIRSYDDQDLTEKIMLLLNDSEKRAEFSAVSKDFAKRFDYQVSQQEYISLIE